jgi:hypothetical protein
MSKSSDNKYYLNIHHRSIAINIHEESGAIEQSYSPGHFYVSLQKNEAKNFFGKYSQGEGFIRKFFSKELIESKREELYTTALKKLEEQTGEEYHSYKSIILTGEQYDAALDYALSKIDGRIEPGNYILAIDDCTDFVQQVYNKAGLPLYFTTAFSRGELMVMGSAAAHNVLQKYGAVDSFNLTFGSVKAFSKETLAKDLNIDISHIISNSPDIDLEAPVFILPSFRVAIEQVELPQIKTVGITASANNPQVTPEEKDDVFDLSDMGNFLPLPEEHKEQAVNDMQDFFTGMLNYSYIQNPNDFDFVHQGLYAQTTPEMESWANDLAKRTEEMLSHLGLDNKRHPSRNPFDSAYNQPLYQTNLTGQASHSITNLLHDDDSLD